MTMKSAMKRWAASWGIGMNELDGSLKAHTEKLLAARNTTWRTRYSFKFTSRPEPWIL
jgi:hypothetical protein